MQNTTEQYNVQTKKEYHAPTLTNQGKLDQKTLTGGAFAGDGVGTSS